MEATMNNQQMFFILNELFFHFEDNIFVNEGVWPRKVNLIFAFSDYIENMHDAEIALYIGSEADEDIKKFRDLARQGIEIWLKENMKTLMI